MALAANSPVCRPRLLIALPELQSVVSEPVRRK
jgi:hypothetical protein